MSRKAELIGQIVTAAIDLSTNTHHDVFVDYSPHVGSIVIRYYFCGWSAEKECASVYKYINQWEVKYFKKELRNIRRLLKDKK